MSERPFCWMADDRSPPATEVKWSKWPEGRQKQVIDQTGFTGGEWGVSGSVTPVSSSNLARPAFKASSNAGGGSFGGWRESINFLRPASKAAEKLGGATFSSPAVVLCCSDVCQLFICLNCGGSSKFGKLQCAYNQCWTSNALTRLFKSIDGT